MTFFDSYILNENNSIENKKILLTFALNTNMYYTFLKPLDIFIVDQMLNFNKNTSHELCFHYFCNNFNKEMVFIIIILSHIYYLCNML